MCLTGYSLRHFDCIRLWLLAVTLGKFLFVWLLCLKECIQVLAPVLFAVLICCFIPGFRLMSAPSLCLQSCFWSGSRMCLATNFGFQMLVLFRRPNRVDGNAWTNAATGILSFFASISVLLRSGSNPSAPLVYSLLWRLWSRLGGRSSHGLQVRFSSHYACFYLVGFIPRVEGFASCT